MTILFWILLAVCVVVLDALTGSFLFCWFAIGALGATIAELLGVGFAGQILTFLVISITTIAIGYPWAKKKFKENVKHTPLREEGYIGKTFIAEENIISKSRVKLDGTYWTVDNEGIEIKKGEKYTISEIKGNKLVIKREEN